MIATQPRAELGTDVRRRWGSGKQRIGQIALSYDPDERVAVRRAMEQFHWFTDGWRVKRRALGAGVVRAGVPDGARRRLATQMPCGPDLERHLPGIREFEAAGFTHVTLVQVGADTQERSSAGRHQAAARPPRLMSGPRKPRGVPRPWADAAGEVLRRGSGAHTSLAVRAGEDEGPWSGAGGMVAPVARRKKS
jgi:hypothetical protein